LRLKLRVYAMAAATAAAWRPARVAKDKDKENKEKKRKTGDEQALSDKDIVDEGGAIVPVARGASSARSSKDGVKESKTESGNRRTRRGGRKAHKNITVKTPVVRDQGLKGLVVNLAKLSLQNAQRSRATAGCMVDTVTVPKDHEIAVAIADEGKAYSERAEAMHDKLGKAEDDTVKASLIAEIKSQQAPCKGNLMAMLEVLIKQDVGGANRDAIGKYVLACVDEAPDTTICKLQSVREEGMVMIHMSLRWVPVRANILDAFKQLRFPVKSEQPPPSVAEDTVSAYLDALAA